MTLPNMTLFPQASLETVKVELRLRRRSQFMLQEIYNHRKDSYE